MTSSTNPEAGTVTYTHDADSNVITKADARTITITSSYDTLNRMTGRTYSNGDPSVSYTYDQTTCLAGETACYNVGRRTSVTDAAGSENFSYDKMGREWAEQRTTNSITKSTSYTYNLDGSLATLTYPSGRTITQAYSGGARPVSAIDSANSINYATLGTYAPQGALAGLALGQAGSFAGINLSASYTYRLQPNEFKASSSAGTAMDLTYNFVDASSRNNGNVMGITNNRDTTRSQNFSYDSLNRIATAKTSSTSGSNCWGETYTVDQWANLTSIGAVSGYTGCTQESLSVTATTNNQLTATGYNYTYDSAGNMTQDAVNSYGWNAESEIKSAAGVNYTYDGDGNRIEKSNGKIYWYGAGTEILDESDASGNITDEYVFFGGKRIAHRVVSSGSISYYAEDFLGSSRAITTSTGTLCYDADFYPYGGERVIISTCAQNYKFEGKERDTETGNDDFGARYYTSRLGRWLSADWSSVPAPVPYANLTNPQTLNLYAMTSDNPETFADLDGHFFGCGPSCMGYGEEGVMEGGGLSTGDFSPTPSGGASTNATPATNGTPATNAEPTTSSQNQKPSPCQTQSCNVQVVHDTVTPSPFAPGVVERDITYQAVDATGKPVKDAEISLHEAPLPGKEGGDAKNYRSCGGGGCSNSDPAPRAAGDLHAGRFVDSISQGSSGPGAFRQTFTVEGKSAQIIRTSGGMTVKADSQTVTIRPKNVAIHLEVHK